MPMMMPPTSELLLEPLQPSALESSCQQLLTAMTAAMSLDLQRRVQLPEGDPNKLPCFPHELTIQVDGASDNKATVMFLMAIQMNLVQMQRTMSWEWKAMSYS